MSSFDENSSAETPSPASPDPNPGNVSITLEDVSPAMRHKILELMEAESASNDSTAKVSLQKRQSAGGVVSPESQGDATETEMNDESIVELAEELLGGLKSPTPSEGGKLVDQGNPNGTSRERETAVYNTPTHESTRFSEQGQSEEFQCESRSSGSYTDIKRRSRDRATHTPPTM